MKKSPRQLAEEYGVSRGLIRSRLKAGWIPGTPLTFPAVSAKFMAERIKARRPATTSRLLAWPAPRVQD